MFIDLLQSISDKACHLFKKDKKKKVKGCHNAQLATLAALFLKVEVFTFPTSLFFYVKR